MCGSRLAIDLPLPEKSRRLALSNGQLVSKGDFYRLSTKSGNLSSYCTNQSTSLDTCKAFR